MEYTATTVTTGSLDPTLVIEIDASKRVGELFLRG